MFQKIKEFLPSIIIGLSVIITGILLSSAWRYYANSNKVINVTGSAVKYITSDMGILNVRVATQDVSAVVAYRTLNENMAIVTKFLKDEGLDSKSLEVGTISNYPVYSNNSGTQQFVGYNYSQNLNICLNNVDKIKELSTKISSLVEKGVTVQVDPPQYHFTKLQVLKADVQAEAAKDAFLRAQKIASYTGNKIGNIKNARLGVMQVVPKNSNEVSDYGVNDLTSIEKQIVAVISASFELE